jgi:ankyrin repeat protein
MSSQIASLKCLSAITAVTLDIYNPQSKENLPKECRDSLDSTFNILIDEKNNLKFRKCLIIKAIKENNLEIATYLINHVPLDILITNDIGRNALHVAAALGKDEIVQMIVKKNILDINLKDDFGYSALELAIKNKHLKTIAVLTSKNEV